MWKLCHTLEVPLQSWPLESIQIDFAGPINDLLILIDALTKWPEIRIPDNISCNWVSRNTVCSRWRSQRHCYRQRYPVHIKTVRGVVKGKWNSAFPNIAIPPEVRWPGGEICGHLQEVVMQNQQGRKHPSRVLNGRTSSQLMLGSNIKTNNQSTTTSRDIRKGDKVYAKVYRSNTKFLTIQWLLIRIKKSFVHSRLVWNWNKTSTQT